MVTIRAAKAEDLDAAAVLAGELLRLHHAFDPKRYIFFEKPEAGYRGFLESQLSEPRAVFLVAEIEGKVAGYCYGRMEPRNWMELLDAHGKLHDVCVDEAARGKGVGEMLVQAMFEALKAKGAPRIVLTTAFQNEPAQKLFAKMGFRTTMLEMTREADS